MKILFLQLWYDLYGGIETVNDTLATQFNKDGYDTSILCLWSKGNGEFIETNKYEKIVIDNEPKRASYKKMIKELCQLKFKNIPGDIKKSFRYYQNKKLNYNSYSKKISDMNPDFIIVSNLELLPLVPKKLLDKTIVHLHTSTSFYAENKKFANIIKKYNNKVKKVVWLSSNFEKESKNMGFTNGTFINNPVRIKCSEKNNLENKNISFIGRLAEPKRPELLAKIFNESRLAEKKWCLKIYGTGDASNIEVNKNVCLMGGTDDVKSVLLNSSIFALTSWYEGFPMVILEAYECGVPVIIFDYGISASELVKNGETGFIVPLDDKKQYIEKLKYLCENSEAREKMGKQAKEFVKCFYPENISKKWYKLFRGEL